MILQFQIERKNKIENSSRTAWGGNKGLSYFSRCFYLWICTILYRILPKEMLYWWWRRNARKRHELMND